MEKVGNAYLKGLYFGLLLLLDMSKTVEPGAQESGVRLIQQHAALCHSHVLTESRVILVNLRKRFAICRYLLPTHMEVTDLFSICCVRKGLFVLVDHFIQTNLQQRCLLEQH